MLNLGYACINTQLAAKGFTTNRSMIRKTFDAKGLDYASELALNNITDLYHICKWNIDNNINVFRITSSLFPQSHLYKIEDLPEFESIKYYLGLIGKLPIRLSFHPDHFNKLATSDAKTLASTVYDLEHHSHIMDLMGLIPSHYNKINIHVGASYGDKFGTLEQFVKNYALLSDNLKKRLTVENDDKGALYTVGDLVYLNEQIGIPIVFDYFHHSIHNEGMNEQDAFETAYLTWPNGVKPVFHYSSSRRDNEDSTAKVQAHADYIYEKINTYDLDIDVVLEAKAKEGALIKYRNEFRP